MDEYANGLCICDDRGRPALDTVPGSGIVMPGGANIYYLDLAPGAASGMVRPPSATYLPFLLVPYPTRL